MAGSRRTFCPPTVWQISAVLLLAVVATTHPLAAQASQDVRIEYAYILPDETLRIHVSVPRGRTIEQASLSLGAAVVPLNITPVPLPVTQWLILDQSAGVINTAPTIQAAVMRFLQGLPASTRTGLIIYTDTVTQFQPSAVYSEISSWLGNYSARANTPGCVGDALAQMARQAAEPHAEALRVLLIAGPLSRQGLCAEAQFQPFGMPVDTIIVGDEIDDFYQDIRERSGGTLLRANIQTVAARVNEVKALWSNPVYVLDGRYSDQASSGTLTLTLSDGAQVRLTTRFERLSASAATSVSDGGSLTVIQDTVAQPSTVAPETIAQLPMAIPADSAPPTSSASAAPLPATTAPVFATGTPVPVITTQLQADNAPRETQVAAIVPSAFPTQISEQAAPPQTTAVPLPQHAETVSQSDAISVVPIIGGAALIVLAIIAGVTLRRRRRADASIAPLRASAGDHTEIEFQDAPAPVMDPFDITEMADEPASLVAPVDDFELTEIVTEADLLLAMRQPVALLHVEPGGQRYPICSPQTLIGRLETSDICLTDDRQISREHVALIVSDSNMLDLEIRTGNAVLINGHPARGRQPVHIGDTIQLSTITSARILAPEE